MEAPSSPQVPTETFKTFGLFGPTYEVGRALYQRGNGDWLVKVTVVETGEVVEYRLADLLDDPEAD